MSQKPIDERSKYATRGHLWATMLGLVTFRLRELVIHTTYRSSTVRSYLKSLVAANVLTFDGYFYTIDPETAPVDPPRVRQDGSIVTQGMGRRNMWRSMRMLKEFTPAQLRAFSSVGDVDVSQSEAEYYADYVSKGGFISLIAAGPPKVYRFNQDRYTGPKPPMIQKVLNVYDQNTGKVVWQSGKGPSTPPRARGSL